MRRHPVFYPTRPQHLNLRSHILSLTSASLSTVADPFHLSLLLSPSRDPFEVPDPSLFARHFLCSSRLVVLRTASRSSRRRCRRSPVRSGPNPCKVTRGIFTLKSLELFVSKSPTQPPSSLCTFPLLLPHCRSCRGASFLNRNFPSLFTSLTPFLSPKFYLSKPVWIYDYSSSSLSLSDLDVLLLSTVPISLQGHLLSSVPVPPCVSLTGPDTLPVPPPFVPSSVEPLLLRQLRSGPTPSTHLKLSVYCPVCTDSLRPVPGFSVSVWVPRGSARLFPLPGTLHPRFSPATLSFGCTYSGVRLVPTRPTDVTQSDRDGKRTRHPEPHVEVV